MPRKNFTAIKLPGEQPDCCADCPLCGLIPKAQRSGTRYQTHVCLGTWEALTSKGITVHASRKDARHPLSRPCDTLWAAWMELPGRLYRVPNTAWAIYRKPYEDGQQFKIKF